MNMVLHASMRGICGRTIWAETSVGRPSHAHERKRRTNWSNTFVKMQLLNLQCSAMNGKLLKLVALITVPSLSIHYLSTNPELNTSNGDRY